MTEAREQPYIWVTWLTRLLAGESQCEWSAWFRAHHTGYDKVPNEFDLAGWTMEHNDLVATRREQLQRDGYEVHVEDENAFRRIGKTGIVVSGKPDILAVRDRRGIVEECKTGRPRASDPIQALVYLLLLPIKNPRCAGVELAGRVVYKTSSVDVPRSALDEAFRERFVHLVHRVGGGNPLPKAPSWSECRWCDIASSVCLCRVNEPPSSAEAETDLF